MKEKIIIKKGRKEDIERLWPLEIESSRYHKKITGKKYPRLNKSKIDKNSKSNFIKGLIYYQKEKDAVFMVAEISNKICGYIVGKITTWNFSDFPPKLAKIDDMAVFKRYRKKGIGTKLIKEFEKWAKQKKVYALALNVWFKNIPARRLYEKNKFEDYHIYMVKRLK